MTAGNRYENQRELKATVRWNCTRVHTSRVHQLSSNC